MNHTEKKQETLIIFNQPYESVLEEKASVITQGTIGIFIEGRRPLPLFRPH